MKLFQCFLSLSALERVVSREILISFQKKVSLLGCSQLRNLIVTKPSEENPNLHVDNEHDRDFNHRTVGKRNRVHYDNGWFAGCDWYNGTMKQNESCV